LIAINAAPHPGATLVVVPAILARVTSNKERSMSNIIRNDPVQDLARAFDPLREFESAFGWPKLRHWLAELPSEPAIKLDVSEDEKAYHVKAELPGVKKEDIAVDIDGNQVSLTAESRRATEEKKGETVVHCERFYGKQFRTFTLRQDIDRKAAVAKFADGVLELTLPKNGAPAAQRIAIQ
jgi:HSP20 family protein